MDTLALATDNLQLAQLLLENRPLTDADAKRIDRGASFVKGILSAVRYLNEGTVEDLDDTYFKQLRHTSRTLAQLSSASSYPMFRSYLQRLQEQLVAYREGSVSLSTDDREQLRGFFSAIGQALVSDEVNGDDEYEMRPTIDELAMSA